MNDGDRPKEKDERINTGKGMETGDVGHVVKNLAPVEDKNTHRWATRLVDLSVVGSHPTPEAQENGGGKESKRSLTMT
jgi:hypothetical protein